MSGNAVPEYTFKTAAASHTMSYLLGPIERLLPPPAPGLRAIDIGCGNGFVAGWLMQRGYSVVGVDASRGGIDHAKKNYPNGRFECIEITDDLCGTLNEQPFDLVISTEVVEHLYAPRTWAQTAFKGLKPGGRFICSTPYHGFLKNLALSLTNKWDDHHTPLWDGGHIKFWSRATLGRLLSETGFVNIGFVGAGRAPYLWKGMVMSGDKPR